MIAREYGLLLDCSRAPSGPLANGSHTNAAGPSICIRLQAPSVFNATSPDPSRDPFSVVWRIEARMTKDPDDAEQAKARRNLAARARRLAMGVEGHDRRRLEAYADELDTEAADFAR
jgi:hypothetical protein